MQGLEKQLEAVFANQPDAIKNYFKYTADEMLQMPHTTGDAVPVAFSLHYPVMQEGTAIFQHMGGVLQEDTTTEESIEGLVSLMKFCCVHVTRSVRFDDDRPCGTNPEMLKQANM